MFHSNGKPTPPVNMLADFAGGGLMCALGILIAIQDRSRTKLGQVVDLSMVEGARYVSSYLWHTQKSQVPARPFIWPNQGKKEANLLDGGAHFYTVYQTRDGRWISVGAIEPQFYSRLLDALQVDSDQYPQFEVDNWPGYKREFAKLFAAKTFAQWIEVFKDHDACVEPIYEYDEVEGVSASLMRPHFNSDGTPKPAPILSRTPAEPNLRDPDEGEHTAEVLKEHGFTEEEIVEWSKSRVIECNLESKL